MSWLDFLTWPRAAISNIEADLAWVRVEIPARLKHLEKILMTAADNLAARIDAATNELAADLTSVRDALQAALADADAATQAAVNAELAKLDAPIARLEALGADPADPVPAAEPVTEPVAPEGDDAA